MPVSPIPDHGRNLRVLVAAVDPWGLRLVTKVTQQLADLPGVTVKPIPSSTNIDVGYADDISNESVAAELCEWADLLCLVPVDAHTIAQVIHGFADTLLLQVVRSWEVSKRILLVPAMSTLKWENPMSKKHLSKLNRKWNWVKVLQPILWTFDNGVRDLLSPDIVNEASSTILDLVQNQVNLFMMEQEVSMTRPMPLPLNSKLATVCLPPEIWTIIIDHTGDWELAQALHMYSSLPRPRDWHRSLSLDPSQLLMKNLEWTILTGTLSGVKDLLASNPQPQWLSHLCVKLTVKFSKLSLLSHLETHYPRLFWEAFGHKRIPTLASATFGKVDVLEWWRTSPSFLAKEYTVECIDGASRAGFVHILDWWRASGLPLRYTEASLEQASSRGDIDTLGWWKRASDTRNESEEVIDSEPYLESLTESASFAPILLKVGKSIVFAAQQNQIAALRWWHESGIPYAYDDQVAKIASASGYTQVLQLWKELKGEGMVYDNQVLVAATKHGHAEVLDWWKYSGYKVEYKTCDVEEALEDSVSGKAEAKIRKWWANNGLNLGISTSEWTKSKTLN